MSVFSGCRKLVSSVFQRSVLLERSGVCRNVFREQSHSLCFTRRFPPSSASRQQRPHVFTCQPNTRRCSSEANSQNSDSEKQTEVSLEESHESHGDSRAPGPSDTFTLDVLVSLLRQENAADICVIKVPDQIKYAEYFIVVSGTSQRHLRAMALYAIKVYKFLKKDGDPNVKTEGKDAEDWMCIDFGNMVVHFMLPEARELYELEKLWTLRSYDEQLRKMPVEKLPEDFIYDVDVTK
ncbi:mitochondrial assembly of ribosomal large subunit protein 1 [Paralichthys olivaceus]|uniref:mitochondrial assembly of ribosomal large subunit protein 1 n=1 Tax=Paralichthys olivaceus TaxID=8255 RepID=UPI00097D51F3|nr:PREDICTED: mitochondrial assembly of ribosomal large subunit protein 1 [Paralichthys olivaceus]